MNSSDFDIGVLKLNPHYTDEWTWIIIVICLILIGIARASNYSYLLELFSPRTNLNQKHNSLASRSSYLLTVNFFLITSLYLTLIIKQLPIIHLNTSIPTLLYVMISFLMYQVLKVGLMFSVANWFNRKFYFDINQLLRFYQIIGIILVPIVALSYFQTDSIKYWFLIFSLAISFILFSYFLFKNLKIALQYNISFFYIILYLCTLEIMPIILMVRYLTD